jgi:hypothetical protein
MTPLDPLEEELLDAFRAVRARTAARSKKSPTSIKAAACVLVVAFDTHRTIGGDRFEGLTINTLDAVSVRDAEQVTRKAGRG